MERKSYQQLIQSENWVMPDSIFLKFENSNYFIFNSKNDSVREITNLYSDFKIFTYLFRFIFWTWDLTAEVVVLRK